MSAGAATHFVEDSLIIPWVFIGSAGTKRIVNISHRNYSSEERDLFSFLGYGFTIRSFKAGDRLFRYRVYVTRVPCPVSFFMVAHGYFGGQVIKIRLGVFKEPGACISMAFYGLVLIV